MQNLSSFYQQLKVINKIYKPNTATLLMLLLDKHKYWAANPKRFQFITNKPFKGHFFVSRSTIEREINLKRAAQYKAEKELEDDNILVINSSPGRANWYTIKQKELIEKLQSYQPKSKVEKEEILEDKDYYPFDDTEKYNELIAANPDANQESADPTPEDGENKQGEPEENKTTTPSENEQLPCAISTANNNIDLRIDTKNKVSNNATYVPDGTESTDSALDLDTSCSKTTNNSCIKDKSVTKAPPRSAPTGTGDEVQDIVNEYNAAMGLPQANGDYNAVFKNLDKFRKIRKYFTPKALELAWKNFGDDTASKLDTKRVSALVSYKVLDPFVQRRESLYTYIADYWDNSLDKLFRSQCQMINELTPDKYTVNRFGELEVNGQCAATTKAHRRDRIEVYKNYIEPKLLPDEELHDMIIDMEVPEWII